MAYFIHGGNVLFCQQWDEIMVIARFVKTTKLNTIEHDFASDSKKFVIFGYSCLSRLATDVFPSSNR